VLASVAAGDGTLRVPSTWLAAGPADLGRVRAIAAAADGAGFTAADGVVGDLFHRWQDLGSEARPISSSALHVLLGCPHRFLLERGLHWREPPQRPTTDAIEPVTYGTLFHEICETLMREAGPQICRKDGSVEWWARRACEIAGEAFDRLVERYPLRGSEARERERQRLFAQIESLVRDEWDRPQRTFVAAEMPFGRDQRVALPAGDATLHVWGAIDRVDTLPDGTLSVRDIKTGRVRDLAEEEVNSARDLQIGMYSAVVEAIDTEGRRVGEASYVHPSTAQEPERAFRGAQLDGLRQRTGEWLRVAAELLAHGTFVRTPSFEDCRLCPFLPRCGTGAQARSDRKLAALPQTDPLAAFLAMKRERKFEE
jgi:RecB family exonuclease